MPPPLKISRDILLAEARRIVTASGPGALNARALGKALGVSARPLYTHFASMEALKAEVLSSILRDYQEALTTKTGGTDRFLSIGLAEIRFAREHPGEYRLIHDLAPPDRAQTKILWEQTLDHLEREGAYRGLDRKTMADLLGKMALFTRGLASAVGTGFQAEDSDEEILRLLSQTGEALIAWAKNKK